MPSNPIKSNESGSEKRSSLSQNGGEKRKKDAFFRENEEGSGLSLIVLGGDETNQEQLVLLYGSNEVVYAVKIDK